MSALTAASAVPALETIAKASSTVPTPIHLALVMRLRASDLCDQVCEAPRAQGGISEVLECLAVSLDPHHVLLVPIAEPSLNEDQGRFRDPSPNSRKSKLPSVPACADVK
jgi:hypothetical protein